MDRIPSTIQVYLKPGYSDINGEMLKKQAGAFLGIETGNVLTGKLYLVDYNLSESELREFSLLGLSDSILHTTIVNEPVIKSGYKTCIIVAKQPGVTDDEGVSAQNTMADILNKGYELKQQHIFTQEIYFTENLLTPEQAKNIAEQLLGNRQIHHFIYAFNGEAPSVYVPSVKLTTDNTIEILSLSVSDDELMLINTERHLALTLEEMKALQRYYNTTEVISERAGAGLPENPTDCELEIFAQTWSEHCKHKEFNAVITFTDEETGITEEIDSLFKTYIRKATDTIAGQLKERGEDWLVKVFTDNAGAVKINDDSLFVWKVETHNSPSAIDPYGGAITGILGNNRDPLGTGVGGAKLLFNTNVLCFGRPDYSNELLPGQLHPKRIFEGVRKGIEDGGNKSGIPTINGSVIFDNRYSGKPLVYCGTGGVLPAYYGKQRTEEKSILSGDLIVSCGGRIGKDGIHGATFSSRNLDETSPQSAVQIGSPITQKLVADFMEIACKAGLIQCSTDCGAGGLSSAIGELAQISGGAEVELENALLKYAGLKPWEIFLSESQERMILVVNPENRDTLEAMANKMDVELSFLGKFTDSGKLIVKYKGNLIAYLSLDFLHNRVPKKYLHALRKNKPVQPFSYGTLTDFRSITLKLLQSYNICSREYLIRRYDHEVKGKTIIKPLMGVTGDAPQDAAVQRFNFDSYQGVAVSNGIMPKFTDADAYASAAGAFDEALRQIIATGGKLPGTEKGKGLFWSVNDNFCVPDSVYDEHANPDGKEKLGKLVLMCKALHDMSLFYGIPMTSGKDSMKNDFKAGNVKISVPPTVLFSMATKIPDVRETLTSEFKVPGTLIYQVGKTFAEMACSEFASLMNVTGGLVPVVRPETAKQNYQNMMQAHEEKLLLSAHDISDGGMLIAAIESCFGTCCGMELNLSPQSELQIEDILFSESHSRFIVSVLPENRKRFEEIFGTECFLIGEVKETPKVEVYFNNHLLFEESTFNLLHAFKSGLGVN